MRTQQVRDVGGSLTVGGTVGAIISLVSSNALKCAIFTLRHTSDMLEVER